MSVLTGLYQLWIKRRYLSQLYVTIDADRAKRSWVRGNRHPRAVILFNGTDFTPGPLPAGLQATLNHLALPLHRSGDRLKLLCVADMHLGRVPARLHEDLVDRVAELGPSAAWRRAVELALDERVDGVLLAGDLVDGGNDFFEAFAHLRDGVRRLTEHGVQVVAVAGNHDPEVLARLVQVVPEVRLLGAGGAWECFDLRSASGARVRVVGWSFPRRLVEERPLAGGELVAALVEAAGSGPQPLTTLGLLHADRDVSGSRYAPVSSAELAAAPVDAWLLGHVHAPDAHLLEAQTDPSGLRGPGYRGGYLGSLCSNDPGEPGARGAWLLEVSPDGSLDLQHRCLTPLRWEYLELDVTELATPEDVEPALVRLLEELSQSLLDEGSNPLAVGCRVALTGRTPFRAELERLLANGPSGTRISHELVGVHFFVDEVRVQALPVVDLEELARRDDPVGLLAARIVALRQPGSALRERLVAAAIPKMGDLNKRSDYGGGALPVPEEDEVVDLLEDAALKALDALLAQVPPADGARGSGGAA